MCNLNQYLTTILFPNLECICCCILQLGYGLVWLTPFENPVYLDALPVLKYNIFQDILQHHNRDYHPEVAKDWANYYSRPSANDMLSRVLLPTKNLQQQVLFLLVALV